MIHKPLGRAFYGFGLRSKETIAPRSAFFGDATKNFGVIKTKDWYVSIPPRKLRAKIVIYQQS